MKSLTIQHSTQMITRDNQISFLRFDGSISEIQCKSPMDTELVVAATDSMSAGHIFGLSKQGVVYIFRTSNLLQAPEATECYLDTHFTVFTALNEGEEAVGLKTVKGGIIVSTSMERNFYVNATTFMLERFNPYAIYEL